MNKKIIAIILLISLLIRTESVSSPAAPLWGNPEYITYDAATKTWTNNNPGIEHWRHQGDAELVKKLTAPEKVPTRKDIRLTFSKNVFYYSIPRLTIRNRGTSCQLETRPSRRFILINVEESLLDLTNENDRQYRVWPHLGILFVGTAAHEEGYEVLLWDELVQGQVPLKELVKPGDIVGFSLVVTGIERGMKLAAQAKLLGARYCIAGNDSAIFRSKNILARPDKPIDAVFTGNSIVAVKSFFRDIDTVGIQNLKIPGVETTPNHQQRSNEYVALLQEQQERKLNPNFQKDDVFIVPKLDLFGEQYWNEIWQNYRNQFGHKHTNPETVRNALAFFAQGCTRTRGTDVCSYCTIAGVGDFRIASDEYFIQTKQAYDACGIDMIFCVTDSLYEMVPVLEKFKRFKMKWNAMTIYGRAQGIVRNPHLLDEWMSVVNDRLLINVGMDSGDNKLLHQGVVKSSITQGSRLSENHEAVKLIKAGGAHLHYSLIFGIPGETLDSCNRSIEFLEWTIQTLGHQLDIAETDKYWLNYGSPSSAIFHSYEHAVHLAGIAGKTISKSDWHKHFASYANELVVPMHVEAAWYHFFTHIDMDTADEFNNRAAAIMAKHTGSIRGRAFKPTA